MKKKTIKKPSIMSDFPFSWLSQFPEWRFVINFRIKFTLIPSRTNRQSNCDRAPSGKWLMFVFPSLVSQKYTHIFAGAKAVFYKLIHNAWMGIFQINLGKNFWHTLKQWTGFWFRKGCKILRQTTQIWETTMEPVDLWEIKTVLF